MKSYLKKKYVFALNWFSIYSFFIILIFFAEKMVIYLNLNNNELTREFNYNILESKLNKFYGLLIKNWWWMLDWWLWDWFNFYCCDANLIRIKRK